MQTEEVRYEAPFSACNQTIKIEPEEPCDPSSCQSQSQVPLPMPADIKIKIEPVEYPNSVPGIGNAKKPVYKNFKCALCAKEYTSKVSLKNHLMKIHGEKPETVKDKIVRKSRFLPMMDTKV